MSGYLFGLAAFLLAAAGFLIGAEIADWWLHDRRSR